MNTPLIVILGETASGKSALAIELAEQCDGEIICADSRTIYQGMDIGTAKPTSDERARVPHHLLDVVEPDQTFSVAQFQTLAKQAIEDIAARGGVPIVVGGTGLYIDSLLFDLTFRSEPDLALRAELEQLSIEELQAEIVRRGYVMPENNRNKRYLVRAIEADGVVSTRGNLRANTLVLGLRTNKEVLEARVTARVEAMVDAGFVNELSKLVKQYGEEAPGLNAPGYKAFLPYLRETCTLQQAKNDFVRNDMRLAKKQRTWFRRSIYQNSIQWVDNRSQAVDLVTTFLNK